MYLVIISSSSFYRSGGALGRPRAPEVKFARGEESGRIHIVLTILYFVFLLSIGCLSNVTFWRSPEIWKPSLEILYKMIVPPIYLGVINSAILLLENYESKMSC
ncbi:hypothetical protein H5410_012240 [Solanum commersonii]|uniref:Uncharacterized protein n=1 Tax=Solanum commersonii TaxID=4109 RepID=A0A9J6AR21_SOLCO|nr:hypothetical protein H5410_012240 [Solanum commersonii]